MNRMCEDGPLLTQDDFARHLNPGLRKQYLLELFPEFHEEDQLSMRRLVVSRKTLVADSQRKNLSDG